MSSRPSYVLAGLASLLALACATVTYDDPFSEGGQSNSGGTSAVAAARGGSGGASSGLSGSGGQGGRNSDTNVGRGGTSSLVSPPPVGSNPPPPAGMGGSGGGSVTIPDPNSGTELLAENFDDGSPANFTPGTAEDDVGEWAVVQSTSGMAYEQRNPAVSDEAFAVGGDIAWKNVSVEVKAQYTQGSASPEDATILLAARFSGLESYYVMEYRGGSAEDPGKVKLRVRADSEHDLADEDAPSTAIGQVVTLKLVVQGTTISAFVNNQQIATATDSAISAGGIALGASEGATVQFDDLVVKVP